MGPIIQITTQFFSRVLIALLAWSFTFIGHDINLKLNQSASTSPQLNTSPIFVEIEERNVDIEKNKISEITATTSTTTENQAPKPKVSTSTPVTKKPINEPSLKNIPVPSIELPLITDEINRGIALDKWSNVYTNSKQTIINIFCVETKGNMVSIGTGSGVIISDNGIILTNSHVAVNFLIPNKDCTIRQGEIAMDKYKASLFYINENWLRKNKDVIFSQGVQGTGENDFAFLIINSKTDGSNVSSNFSHANINMIELTEKNKNQRILVAGYPAGTLGALSLRKYLNFVADIINISNVYTLDGTHIDVFETEATKVGQHGSSGGGIFDINNKLIGLIVSVSNESNNSKINALTTTYISRTLKMETGKTLAEFINTDKNILISSFLSKKNYLAEYVKPYIQ